MPTPYKNKNVVDYILKVALDAAAHGIRVLPVHSIDDVGHCTCGRKNCSERGKHPLIRGWDQEACIDEQAIRSWLRKLSGANVAAIPGPRYLVIDVDPRNGGIDTLHNLESQHGKLPATAVVLTGEYNDERGLHYWFKVPPGFTLRKGKLGAGIEFISSTGYVVLPGSLHHSGVRYEWQSKGHSFETSTEVPAWILAQLDSLGPQDRRLLDEWTPSGDPPSREVMQLLLDGDWPPGEQRSTALRCARALMGWARPLEEVIDLVWNALERSRWTGKPWTQKDVVELVQNLAKNPPEPKHHEHAEYEANDAGNADRFADMFAATTRWVPEWKSWVFWRDSRWIQDVKEFATQQMIEVVRSITQQAFTYLDREQREFWVKFAARSLNEPKIRAAVSLAQSHEKLISRPTEFDNDPYLFNCTNGVLDLRTGELRDHNKEDMHNQQAACSFDPDARCEDWERVLEEALGNHDGLISHVQKIFGYALTGDTSEEKFFFFYGTPGAGKTTLLDAFGGMLGSYSRSMRYETLTKNRHGGGGSGANEDVARLHRARFVVASEFEKNERLAEAFVNTLTGGDKISARFLYKASFEFKPQLKLFLAANHKPGLSGSPESGIWRRLQIIPFDHKVQKTDTKLKHRLAMPEAQAGILAWAVKGCLRWQEEGLGHVPQISQETLDEYQVESDSYTPFLKEVTISQPGNFVTKDDLFQAYLSWARTSGIQRPTTKAKLGTILKERGLKDGIREHQKNDKRTTQRIWKDITLISLGARLKDSEQ